MRRRARQGLSALRPARPVNREAVIADTLTDVQAAALGCSARACWLIAHHEDHPPPADPALRQLIDADRRS